MVQKNYIYNKVEASINAALYPIFFGVSISFGVYTFNRNLSGNKNTNWSINKNAIDIISCLFLGWFGKMFDWKYFQIATKVAYALYLVQFPVFFYNVGLTKHVDEYQSYYQVNKTYNIFYQLIDKILFFFVKDVTDL
jgi:hypothetical protein